MLKKIFYRHIQCLCQKMEIDNGSTDFSTFYSPNLIFGHLGICFQSRLG